MLERAALSTSSAGRMISSSSLQLLLSNFPLSSVALSFHPRTEAPPLAGRLPQSLHLPPRTSRAARKGEASGLG